MIMISCEINKRFKEEKQKAKKTEKQQILIQFDSATSIKNGLIGNIGFDIKYEYIKHTIRIKKKTGFFLLLCLFPSHLLARLLFIFYIELRKI